MQKLRIAAWLLWKNGLPVDALVTHTYWVNKTAGKTFTDRDVQCCNPVKEKKWWSGWDSGKTSMERGGTGVGYGEKILAVLKTILATKPDEEMEEETVTRYNKISDMPSPPLSRWWTAASSADVALGPRTKTTSPLTWICPWI